MYYSDIALRHHSHSVNGSVFFFFQLWHSASALHHVGCFVVVQRLVVMRGLGTFGMQSLLLWHTGLVAPQRVGS